MKYLVAIDLDGKNKLFEFSNIKQRNSFIAVCKREGIEYATAETKVD